MSHAQPRRQHTAPTLKARPRGQHSVLITRAQHQGQQAPITLLAQAYAQHLQQGQIWQILQQQQPALVLAATALVTQPMAVGAQRSIPWPSTHNLWLQGHKEPYPCCDHQAPWSSRQPKPCSYCQPYWSSR
jgi:hypothetical protein